MFHWQWFILVITISFVVSNAGERINRRTINIDPTFKKRETRKPSKLSTHVTYPLWVTISGLGSLGAETQYKKINDKLYEFTLPFYVIVKESDVNANRSAKQDANLAYPFWVRISEVNDEHANRTVAGTVRLAFPFDLEVARVSLIGSEHPMVEPTNRNVVVLPTFVGSISLTGTIAVGMVVIGTVTGAILITHVLRTAINTLWQTAVDIFRPHPIPRPAKTIIGSVVGSVTGVIVSFVPGLQKIIQAGIVDLFQTLGDSLVTFVRDLFKLSVIGDIRYGINIVINVFYSLPFVSWSRHSVPPTVSKSRSPPDVIIPVLPPPPPSDKQKVVIRIYYGQETIPGFPEYIIAWPGKSEPPVTDLIILRPIIPTLPSRPHIRLVWPVQATTNVRPNVILIKPFQTLIPGYVNVIIVWPNGGPPVPQDPDLIVVRPNDPVIPNIIGVRLMWPGVNPEHGPYTISLLPRQRQDPQFPSLIFVYPGDPKPPNYPSITFVHPPASTIPDYPGITIIWPPEFQGPSKPKPKSEPIVIAPDDFQVPGHPNVIIVKPGQPPPPPAPGVVCVRPGQPYVPEVPGLTLTWPPPPGPDPEASPYVTVSIPPEFRFVPGYSEYVIMRVGMPPTNSPKSVRPGEKTLPDRPTVFLVWLDRPTDLALEPMPDIMVYDRVYRRKRSVDEAPAFSNEILAPAREYLQMWKTDFTEVRYGRRNTTVDDMSIGTYGKVKFGYEKDTVPKPWKYNIKKSQLRQHFEQLFGLSCQG